MSRKHFGGGGSSPPPRTQRSAHACLGQSKDHQLDAATVREATEEPKRELSIFQAREVKTFSLGNGRERSMLKTGKRCLKYRRSGGSQQEDGSRVLCRGRGGPWCREPAVPRTGQTWGASLVPAAPGCLGIGGMRKKRQNCCHLYPVRFSLHLTLKKIHC